MLRLRICEVISPLPHTFMAGYLVKHRNNFAFSPPDLFDDQHTRIFIWGCQIKSYRNARGALIIRH
jgi:hypothetical protein